MWFSNINKHHHQTLWNKCICKLKHFKVAENIKPHKIYNFKDDWQGSWKHSSSWTAALICVFNALVEHSRIKCDKKANRESWSVLES